MLVHTQTEGESGEIKTISQQTCVYIQTSLIFLPSNAPVSHLKAKVKWDRYKKGNIQSTYFILSETCLV